ncbi:hypothetical protein SAMN02982929_01610 [Saccharopolyspora kobensis]|uniref:Uncharacterized protein n=1 Tax=Saccharopolyspora kobensis TaxID=146035 RepID=A0A1H5XR16_9PSEU|nr:hypothetical protein [Saccharopolyspora kobensis]SEG14134.1 hypothetical protein SAMN02982929_01610 [Saccharopolyspora kobensis]SFE39131.1 hypothetical protein SAMN05216506_11114 [Saccharopolyspora kobensis]
MTRTVAVRFAFGVVGEARREVHLTTAPGTGIPAIWRTFCGVEIPAHQAEVSEHPAGMPCIRCLTDATRAITS